MYARTRGSIFPASRTASNKSSRPFRRQARPISVIRMDMISGPDGQPGDVKVMLFRLWSQQRMRTQGPCPEVELRSDLNSSQPDYLIFAATPGGRDSHRRRHSGDGTLCGDASSRSVGCRRSPARGDASSWVRTIVILKLAAFAVRDLSRLLRVLAWSLLSTTMNRPLRIESARFRHGPFRLRGTTLDTPLRLRSLRQSTPALAFAALVSTRRFARTMLPLSPGCARASASDVSNRSLIGAPGNSGSRGLVSVSEHRENGGIDKSERTSARSSPAAVPRGMPRFVRRRRLSRSG